MESNSLFADILKLIKMTFDEIKASNLSVRKILYYDLYRALHTMNCELYVTLEHYLALTFEEPFLVETTSFSSGIEKWRTILNEDFARATQHIQTFLRHLQYISYDDEGESMGLGVMQKRPLDDYIEHKNFYDSIARYNAGIIAQDSFILEQTCINFPALKKESLTKRIIDLSTYEKRLRVKENGLAILTQLLSLEEEMKQQLRDTTSIEDLLVEAQSLKLAR